MDRPFCWVGCTMAYPSPINFHTSCEWEINGIQPIPVHLNEDFLARCGIFFDFNNKVLNFKKNCFPLGYVLQRFLMCGRPCSISVGLRLPTGVEGMHGQAVYQVLMIERLSEVHQRFSPTSAASPCCQVDTNSDGRQRRVT